MVDKPLPRLFLSKFSKVIENPDSKTITIISATEEGVSLGAGTQLGGILDAFPGGIHIFTEKLSLSPFEDDTKPTFMTNSARFLNIAASEVITTGDSTPLFSVSGAAGTDNIGGGSDHESATNGKAGNILNFYLQNLPSQSTPLRLEAKGGDGATTGSFSVAAGAGGNGGKISITGHSCASTVLNRLQQLAVTWKLPETWSDAQEKAAEEWNKANFRLSELESISSLARFSMARKADEELCGKVITALGNAALAKRCTIYSVTAAVNDAIGEIDEALDVQKIPLLKACVVTGGRGGSATRHKGESGINGSPGNVGERAVNIITNGRFESPSFIFVHPLQCEMLLEKARTYFYFGDDRSRQNADRDLRSVVQKITALLAQDQTTLTETLASYEKQKQILGITATTNLLPRFENILKQAKALLFQLTCTNIDYYGLREDWVPRFTAAAFDEEADKALVQLSELENLYSDYGTALDANNIKTQFRDQLMNKSFNTQAGISSHVEQLKGNLVVLYDRLRDPSFVVRSKDLRYDIDFALRGLKEKIKFTFTLSLQQITDVAVDFASEPSKGAAAKAGGKLAWDAITKVPDDSGAGVDKSLLLKGIESVSGDLQQNVKDIATSKTSGEVTGPASEDKMLVVQQEELDKLFESFSKAPFADEVTSTIKLVKEYVDLVTARNADIVEYNLTLKAIIDAQETQSTLQQGRTNLQQQTATGPSSTQLALMTMFVEQMYNTSRARVMKLISYYRRAINFSSLREPDMLSLGGFSNEAALNLTCTQLSSMKSELRSRLFDLQDKVGADVNPFPADFDKSPGKFFYLSQAQLTRLLDKKTLDVRIPAVFKHNSGPAKEFAGCADVRVHRARFYLEGLKSNTDFAESGSLVQLPLRHSGDNHFVDVNNQVHYFRHNPIDLSWSYRLQGKKVVSVADSGVLVHFSPDNKGGSKTYAAPSLFTTWTVSLEYLNLDNLDISGVTAGRFEFFGTSRSFAKV